MERPWLRAALILLVVAGAVACCSRHPTPSFTLGTTTSLQGSGLLQALSDAFRRDSGIEIHALVVGSGLALRLASRGEVDVTITHDPDAERRFVAARHARLYRQFMWNDFVIVGPAADPAGILGAPAAAVALQRIAQTRSRFCSRNDESGTHVKELKLWQAAGIRAESNPNYMKMGQPMVALLHAADELQAYALSDRATYEQLARSLHLSLLYSGDPQLRNVYAVTLVQLPKGARGEPANGERFVRWLLSARGRSVIENFRIADRPAFHLLVNTRAPITIECTFKPGLRPVSPPLEMCEKR